MENKLSKYFIGIGILLIILDLFNYDDCKNPEKVLLIPRNGKENEENSSPIPLSTIYDNLYDSYNYNKEYSELFGPNQFYRGEKSNNIINTNDWLSQII